MVVMVIAIFIVSKDKHVIHYSIYIFHILVDII